MKRSVIVGIIPLTAMFVLSGCTTEPTPTPTSSQAAPTPSPSANASDSASPPSTPSSNPVESPDPANPGAGASAWTGQTAYDACVEFQLDVIEKDGYDPDDLTLDPYEDNGMVRQNGADWVVDISGKVHDDADGKDHTTYISCTVSGTPESPKVENLPGY